MQKEVEQLINHLIHIEHLSTTLYLAMSAYLGKLNYTGMASWLKIQSDEERMHLLRLINYLVDRDGTVKIKALEAQPSDFGTPAETFEKVFEHEKFVTDSYRQAYPFAQSVDSQTAVIIQDFLREQTEEVAQAQKIYNRLKIAGPDGAAILLIDQELGQRQPVITLAQG
ncbi:ferritin [Bacillus sp. HMF5848]|uniref:ferritin n=1 Tax=Bacillus sp. HMF5848 TaxID=2495421 RepID=UPI000F7A25AA|nr:ferritin [Bacillus sp. HMF5848]RSK26691.1 ferritin [Bacillus sp. HMF5848]